MYLWRAVDSEGEVLDFLIQSRRDKAAALKLMRKLLKTHGFAPRVVVTDKLRSYGIVRNETVMAKGFVTGDDRPLSEIELRSPGILHDAEDPEMADYVVGVDWKKTFPVSEGKWFEGGFVNRNVVCKLRHPATLEYLIKVFEAEPPQARPQ